MKKPTVILADDHTLVLEGFRRLLEAQCELLATVGDGQALLKAVAQQHPDIVILDISMPGRGGLDILKQLKSERPKLPVLMLTIHPEDQYAVRVLRAGASGYLTKESAPDHLVEAIRKVARGGKYISPHLAERLAFNLESISERPLHEALSDREFQVLRLIASGKTVKEIGEELSLSVKTISTYRTRILEKMKMKNNAEMTHYAIQQKLVE